MRSKIFIMFFCVCFCSTISFSQTINDISKVVLGVRFADGISEATIANKPQLEDRLIKFASQSGYSSFGNCLFFVSPNIVVNSVDIAEGGMKNIYVVHGELYLTIQDATNGTVYSSISFPFRNSATSKEKAIKNAILNINYNTVSTFFDEAKKKILVYYQQQKDIIFARANTCVANGDYEGAITCLMMIPEELTELYSLALTEAQTIYDKRNKAIYQKMIEKRYNDNNSVLTEANSLLAMHKPYEALKTLWNYKKGNKEQNEHYSNMIRQAEQLISANEIEELRREERVYQDNKRKEDREWDEYKKNEDHRRNLEKQEMGIRKQELETNERIVHHKLNIDGQKINAIKDIACEYIRNNPSKMSYILTGY